MILSGLLIWFLGTEMMINVSLLKSLGCFFQVKLLFRGFTNKARLSYRGEFNFG